MINSSRFQNTKEPLANTNSSNAESPKTKTQKTQTADKNTQDPKLKNEIKDLSKLFFKIEILGNIKTTDFSANIFCIPVSELTKEVQEVYLNNLPTDAIAESHLSSEERRKKWRKTFAGKKVYEVIQVNPLNIKGMTGREFYQKYGNSLQTQIEKYFGLEKKLEVTSTKNKIYKNDTILTFSY